MGLRSLPFFKAKRGWQIAGGGLTSDGGGGGGSLPVATAETLGGVRIGSGVIVANDGTISTDLHIRTYSNVALSPGTWATLDTAYNNSLLFCVAVGVSGTERYCLTIGDSRVNNGSLQIKPSVSIGGDVTIYVFEKEV